MLLKVAHNCFVSLPTQHHHEAVVLPATAADLVQLHSQPGHAGTARVMLMFFVPQLLNSVRSKLLHQSLVLHRTATLVHPRNPDCAGCAIVQWLVVG